MSPGGWWSLRGKLPELRLRDGEDGSGRGMSLALLLTAAAVFVVFGLVVDGGREGAGWTGRTGSRWRPPATARGPSPVTSPAATPRCGPTDADGVFRCQPGDQDPLKVTVSWSEPTTVRSIVGIDELALAAEAYATLR